MKGAQKICVPEKLKIDIWDKYKGTNNNYGKLIENLVSQRPFGQGCIWISDGKQSYARATVQALFGTASPVLFAELHFMVVNLAMNSNSASFRQDIRCISEF